MQPSRFGTLLPILMLGTALVAWGTVLAQSQDESAPAPPAGGEGAAGGIYAGEDVPPELMSRFAARAYDVRAKKVWEGLLDVLQAAGFPPEIVDKKQRTVRTSYAEFKSDDYSKNPVDPPPPFTSRWNIMTMKDIREGKAAIEALVSREKIGTVVRLRARILVQGLDKRRRLRLLTDRRSSGAIEADLFKKLDAALGLPPS